MLPKIRPQDSTTTLQTKQTPFDRFKEALSVVASVPKSSIPKVSKKSPRKK